MLLHFLSGDMSYRDFLLLTVLAYGCFIEIRAQLTGSLTSNALVLLSSNFDAATALAIRDGNGERLQERLFLMSAVNMAWIAVYDAMLAVIVFTAKNWDNRRAFHFMRNRCMFC